jgi:hypothetical protein
VNYIWEAVTTERLCGADVSDVRFVPARDFSPYMEVNPEDLNETRVARDFRVEVNPYVRFHEIFGSWLNPKFTEFPEYKSAVFDILMHLLLAMDKKSGYDRRGIRRLFIKRDIQSGVYGKEIASFFRPLDDGEKDAVADGLISLYGSGVSVYLHGLVCKRIFPNAAFYLKREGKRVLLLYLGCVKSPRSEAAALLCQRLFLPADLEAVYYWDKHFGVIGMPETMKIGDIALF